MRQTRSSQVRLGLAYWLALAGVVVAGAAALSAARWLQDRRHLVTGRASWIWLTQDLKAPEPIRFFARRDFSWPGGSAGSARALLFVDGRSSLFFNGARVGGGRQKRGDPLLAYDISSMIHPGGNQIEIEAESPDGAGAILFALELPGGLSIVSDGSWRVGRSREELAAGGSPAEIWGRPPMYPWGYPALARGKESPALKSPSGAASGRAS